tara:strand:- start:1394 stop:1819 length:426 start_codon:yes stop_codon:yes gene_type:complete
MNYGESIPSTGLFRITYVKNTGSAFGMLQDQTTWLILASIIAIVVLLFLYRGLNTNGTLIRIMISLQIGGAIGNLADRIRIGYVVDFIDIGLWPVFNIADSTITIGITGMIILILITNANTSADAEIQDKYEKLETDKITD